MISDRALSAMRCAAAVCCAVPDVRLRIEGGGRTLLDVSRPPIVSESEHPVMPACAFRKAVAVAHHHRRIGDRLRFMGLDRECDPSVSYGVRPGIDAALTGGMLRVRHEERWLHLLPVVADPALVAEHVSERIDCDGFSVEVAVHVDEDLGVSILHVSTDVGDHEGSVAALDALTTVASRLSVAELEAYLSPGLDDLSDIFA